MRKKQNPVLLIKMFLEVITARGGNGMKRCLCQIDENPYETHIKTPVS